MALLDTIGQALGSLFGRGENPQSSPDLRYAEDYVAYVEKKFTEFRQKRIPFELQWRLNIAFASGQQYLDINPATQSLEEQPLMYEWQEREVFDQISPILEVRIARLTRGRPIRKVRPASGEQRDITAAEIASKVIASLEQETNHRAQLTELVPWMELCGVAFKKNVWNPEKGRMLGIIQVVDEATGETREEAVYEGDIEPTICPSFEIYAENPHASWEQNRCIIHAKAYPVEEILDRWGVKVDPEPCDAMTLQPTSIGARGLGYGQGGYKLVTSKLENHAVVKEYWERPSKRHPRGRLIIVANRKLLYAGDIPYQVGKDNKPDLPFVPYYCIKKPGSFYGESIVTRLIPVQRRYNALRNRKAEYLKRVAIGQLIVEDGALVNMDEIEASGTAPGQIFIVAPGRKEPSYMQFPPLPNDFDKEEATLLGEFRALSGVSDLAKMSQAPSGVQSGIAMSIALEQDETRLATTANNIEEAIIEEGKQWLRLYKQFAKGPRIARISNRSEVEIVDWTGSDLTSDDVIIEGGSGLGESPAQRRQFIFDLLKSGLLNDPETGQITREGRAHLLQLIEFGHWESAADTDYDLQVAKANRQVKLVKQGILPTVAPFDDPIIHLKVLHRWMLTSEFEELSAMDQRVLVAAYQFEAELMAMLQQRAMMEAQMQGQPASGPPMGGPAPQGLPSSRPSAPPPESSEVAEAMAKRAALMQQMPQV